MEVDAAQRLGRVVLLLLLLSACLAAGGRFEMNNYENYNKMAGEAAESEVISSERQEVVHERVLKANTRDYGRYDPAPTLSKPNSKLIPN